jgi:hypothetical protein
MKKSIFPLCFIVALNGCIKDGSSVTSVYIKNSTNHMVAINPYYQGALINEKMFQLNYNESKVIETQVA